MTAARVQRTAMTDQDIIKAFTSLYIGSKKGQPALYKPLLVLFILGRCWNNSERLHLFRDVHQPFGKFLKKFIPPEQLRNTSTIYPFWFMKSSETIWTLVGRKTIKEPKSSKNAPTVNDALNSALHGGFTERVHRRIMNDKVMLLEVTFAVLNRYFPTKMHIPLLQATGIPSASKETTSFEQKILSVYQYSCSICGFPGTGNEMSSDLQVAYIKPFAEGGPLDKSENCITMCDKHSNLFDYGTIAISPDDTILVSKQVKEPDSMKGLLAFQDQKASFPDKLIYQPSRDYLAWHRNRIFKP